MIPNPWTVILLWGLSFQCQNASASPKVCHSSLATLTPVPGTTFNSGGSHLTPEQFIRAHGPSFHFGGYHSSPRTLKLVPRTVMADPGQVSPNPFHIFSITFGSCNISQWSPCKPIGILDSHYNQWVFKHISHFSVPIGRSRHWL